MLRDHVSQPRLSGPRSQMLQSSGTDPGSDHGTDHGIRPGAGSDSDFDPQMTVVKKRGSLDPRSFKHMVIAASLLVTLSLLAASIFAYFSAYAPIVESTDTFGQVELDTAVSGKLNDVALPVDDSGSGSGFELAELYSGDVVQFDVTVTNEQNKSAWLAVDIGLQGEAIDVIANGGAATSADIQQYFSIYPTGDMNEVEDLYAAEMADGDSKLTGQTRWRGPLQQGGAYSIFWSEEAKNRVINADSSSTASEDESSVFAAGGAMAGKKIDFLADGAHGNQGTLTYSLHYHPNGALAKLVLDKSLKLSVESYGVQYRNNPNHGMATWDYGYTGVAQLFIAPEDGLYRFEAWGARSGLGYRSNSGLCSNGAYAAGTLEMKAGDEIFVYAGGIGTNALSPKATSFNGGGDAGKDGGSASGGGGGGATDFRLVKSVAADRWSGVESLNSRILVAAGAGGQRDWSSGNVAGVPGGALVSLPGTGQETSQTDGYAFGWGQDGVRGDFPAAGGGGGWYGGKRAWGSAAGGSSFISGYPGSVALDGTDALNAGNPRTHRTDIDSVDKATQVIDGVSYVFTDAEMIAGNVASPRWQNGRDGEKSVGNPGAGHARITALSMERSVTMKFETNGGG
ncbi:glycine rich domain-containing protein [Bifidobacterium fermentum]